MVDLNLVSGETFAGMIIGSLISSFGSIGIYVAGFFALSQTQFFAIDINAFLSTYGIPLFFVVFGLQAIQDIFAAMGIEVIQ
jgi:hypothetical protein